MACAPAPNGAAVREWWWLGGGQSAPVSASQWEAYDPQVLYHLGASWDAMRSEGREEGLVLDLAPFTDPPSPYQVWRAKPREVVNTREKELCGRLTIAGYPKSLWELPLDQLPPSAKHGKVVGGFYQVRRDHAVVVEALDRYLTDPRSPPSRIPEPPRRRVVILIEVERPAFIFGDVDRFRKKRAPRAAASVDGRESDSVPPGEAVFQWWWGDPHAGWGHWKNYHPHVSARLEKALVDNERFRSCKEAVPIDDVRYMLQRISRDCPFDYLDAQNQGSAFREVFLPESVVTTEHTLYDQQTRMTSNCFVQFQRGNPRRRRPVRRIRRGEAAGLEIVGDGPACSVCLSDEGGVLSGCPKGCCVCDSCLRRALKSVVGDSGHQENLVCGCLTVKDTVALKSLAARADSNLQAALAKPPTDQYALKEFEADVALVRQAFFLAQSIPPNIFQVKVDEWIKIVRRRAAEHLYHACAYPECGLENWILRTEFDEQYRSNRQHVWICKQGHRNSVLPVQKDIDDLNRNLLLHPEYYTDRCGHDGIKLRRFRVCPECVLEGQMLLTQHEEGCKQWPGSRSAHRHAFCFSCTSPWGQGPGLCHHSIRCSDPGIQQIRRTVGRDGDEILDIGFVDAQEYISWLRGHRQDPPPTIFRGGEQALGATRQGALGLEDKAAILQTMNEGTR